MTLSTQIANLQQRARIIGQARLKLDTGLAISLYIRADQRAIRFGRQLAWPAPAEIATCSRAGLTIPIDAGIARYNRQTWNIIEYTWNTADAVYPQQLPLDSIVPPATTPNMTIDERFNAFHQANPHIYQALATLARQFLATGHRRLGIKMLWERLRWEMAIHADTDDGAYHLNNIYTSRYARLLSEQEPDLHGCFELRELRA